MWPLLLLSLAVTPRLTPQDDLQLAGARARGSPLVLHVAAGVRSRGPAAQRLALRAGVSLDLLALLAPTPVSTRAPEEERARRQACMALAGRPAPTEDAVAEVVARAAHAARWAALGCAS
ncbi:MAG: hypothetical protein H6730_00105 [Deltaproteobacteria bacterium]|nr:hypothetical protein [Deltaproteobacteria bacterium]